jgi:hypothetical protein
MFERLMGRPRRIAPRGRGARAPVIVPALR